MSDQFIYFIQADESGPIKIGFTADDPKRRLGQLQTGNASTLKLLGAIRGSIADEKRFHAALSEWRLQGEWFAPHKTVLDAVERALSDSHEPENCGGAYCSFCGICQHHAAVLIVADDDVNICASCTSICSKIISEHMGYGG